MPKSMKECLEEAAELIEKKGWVRNKYWTGPQGDDTAPEDRNRFCMLGACRTACPEQENRDFAQALGFGDQSDAFRWNDAKARSGKQVIARLREAAAKLEQAGERVGNAK